MKRAEKIALLTKLIEGNSSQTARRQLQQAMSNAPRSLIIIDDLDFEKDQPMTDSDPVRFQDRGVEHRMTLKEAQQYARRYQMHTLFILPTKP